MEERRDQRRPTTQEDLAAILGNPDALRLLAFGAKAMGRFVETGRTMSRLAFEATGLAPTSSYSSNSADRAHDRVEGSSDRATPAYPEGTMLVPVDAWNRVLEQLGNLHEAGQALAEARERAGRAETAAEFHAERRQALEVERDRLAAELAELRAAASTPARPEPARPEPARPDPPVATTAPVVTTRSRRIRGRLIRILER